MAEKCGKCNASIVQGKDALKCVECNSMFHLQCAGLASDKVSTRSKWKCDGCVSRILSSGSQLGGASAAVVTAPGQSHGENPILDAIASLRTDVTCQLREVQVDIKKVTGDIEQMKKQLADVNKIHQQTSESVEELKNKNIVLTNKIKTLTNEVNDLQQHSRKCNMIVTGIPATKGENVYAVLERLAKLVNVEFYRADISIAHRLPGKQGSTQPPPLVVNFVSRSAKDHWIFARKQRRSLSAKELQGSFPDAVVYFNEHLTPHTRAIFNAARDLRKEKKLTYVWTSDCKVLVKQTERGPTRRVQQLEDLEQFRTASSETPQTQQASTI